MAVNRIKADVSYGFNNPLQNMSPQPIIAKRNPTGADRAELGTIWVNTLTNAYYIATSVVAGVTNWEAQQTGAGNFAAVNVTGAVGNTLQVTADTLLNGDLAVGGNTALGGNLAITGDVVITGDFDVVDAAAISLQSTDNAPQAIYLHANGGAAETIEVQSSQGTSLASVDINSAVGGILIESVGLANTHAVNIVADAGGIFMDGALAVAVNSGDVITADGALGVTVTSPAAVADSIQILATNAAGGILMSGAGGISMHTTNAAASLATGTGAINLGTDAVSKTITVGNNTGASSVVINAGTAGAGSIHIGQTANAVPIVIGNVTGATGVTINSGTNGIALASTGIGDITLNSSDTVLIDSAGVLELNSSAGVISIGNDAVSQNMNIGTAGTRTLQVGSSTTTSGINIHSGTGGCVIAADANAHDTAIGSTFAGSTLELQTPTGTSVRAANGVTITTAGRGVTLPGGLLVVTGTGNPNTVVTAPIGSLYLNTAGSGVADRAFINTDAGTTWTAITTVA